MGVFLCQAWSESQWKVGLLMRYILLHLCINKMLDAIKHITDDNFFLLSARQRTGAFCV